MSQFNRGPGVLSTVRGFTDHELYQNIQSVSQLLLAESGIAFQNDHQFRYLLQLHYELKRRYQKQTFKRHRARAS